MSVWGGSAHRAIAIHARVCRPASAPGSYAAKFKLVKSKLAEIITSSIVTRRCVANPSPIFWCLVFTVVDLLRSEGPFASLEYRVKFFATPSGALIVPRSSTPFRYSQRARAPV